MEAVGCSGRSPLYFPLKGEEMEEMRDEDGELNHNYIFAVLKK